MKTLLMVLLTSVFSIAHAEIKVGTAAPAFSETDANGKTHQLSDYKNKWVVLEWYNKDCPYVKKHYGANNMQKLQEEYTKKGVVWLTVNSSAKDKEGYQDPTATLATAKTVKSKASAILIDSDGNMGKAYDAKTTPHMFVIDPKGIVVYAGAIDSNKSSDPETIPTAKNYVKAALDSGMAGKTIETTSSKPYGCSVKYQ